MTFGADAMQLPDDVVDAAVAWSVRLHYNRPSARDRRDFGAWLRSDARHALAWERIAALRSDVSGLPAQAVLDTLQAAGARNARRRAVKLLAFSGLALGSAWMAREHAPWQRVLADASTVTGERRTLLLADGTTVRLNTDSALRIVLAGEQRMLHLLRGEMLVTTGEDAQALAQRGARRPFRVATPYGEMQALGTRFAVRLDAGRARVSVQEGRVALHPGVPAGPVQAVARPGQHWALAASGAARLEAPAVDAFAWSEGVIAGRDMRLADFLAELARHRPGVISCDERVADLRLSGVYHLHDTDAVLQFLVQTQPVRVQLTTRFWVRVGPDLPA